ncbi:MAG: GNAT family N-acetyltransferase [Armatimonadota bacterium]
MKTLETTRLILRTFTENDTAIHSVIFSDPEVCRFYCGKTRTEKETCEWLIHRKWQVRGDDELGFLVVVRKADDQILGLVALQLCVSPTLRCEEEPDTPFHPLTIELSYAIGRAYQQQGYATEACRALIEYGFKEMRLPRLTNGVSEENIPTNRLCQKLGFRQVKNVHPLAPGLVWILENTLTDKI